METLAHHDYSSNVDTSRPFSSVQEAVAVLSERLLFREIYSTETFTSPYNNDNPSPTPSTWKYPSPLPAPSPSPKTEDDGNNAEIFDALKKLEAELKETKMDLRLLKEKESENEIALANLNAELHKNKSKLAEAEAEAAVTPAREEEHIEREQKTTVGNSLTLGEILRIGDGKNYYKYYYGGKSNKKERRATLMKKKKKKKPIVPLVTDFLFKKKGSTSLQNHLHSTPNYSYVN